MKTWILFGLIMLPFPGSAQVLDTAAVIRQVDSLIQVSRSLTDQRAYEEALEVSMAAENLALEKLGRETASYGSACFNHGRVQYFMKEYPEAEKWYLESKTIREKILGKEHPDYAKSVTGMAFVYLKMGNYEKSETLYLEAKSIQEKILGKEHPDYASSLHNLASFYDDIGNYEKAELLYFESRAIREKVLGKESPEYAESLNDLAVLYYNMGKFEKAVSNFLECKALREKVLGKEHPKYVNSLYNLTFLYFKMGNYEKAESLHLEVKAIQEKVLGKEHPDYAISVASLADVYSQMGNYEKAEVLYLEAKAIWEKVLGKEHPYYANILYGLAILNTRIVNYEKAEPLYLEVKAIREKVLGKEHPDYAGNLHSLAVLYSDMGNYEKSEQCFLECNVIRKKVLGKEHPHYAHGLDNMAQMYEQMDNYEKAEPLYLEAIAIREKVLGKQHQEYGYTLANMGGMYAKMGNYEKAEPFLHEANAILQKALGKEHYEYANSLAILGHLYYRMRNYVKAELCYLEAKAIREKVLGKEHSNYLEGLYELANVYVEMDNYEKAEPLYLESIATREKVSGKINPQYASTLPMLAAMYKRKGNYEKAEQSFLEAKAIWEKLLAKEHPNYHFILYNLADLYEKQKRYSDSEPLTKEFSMWERKKLLRSATFLSQRELGRYTANFRETNDYLNSNLFARPSSQQGTLPGLTFDNSLFNRGIVLNTSNQIKSLALSDSVATEKYDLLKFYERRLAAEYAKPISEQKYLSELEAKANDLEKELARTVAGYGEAMQQVCWQEVQQKLQEGEAAIEFIHYQYYGKKQSDSIMYAALVLRPGDVAPQFVSLFEEKEIQLLLKYAKGGNIRGINALYMTGTQNSLHDLIWKPIEGYLQDVKTVYCSPSGLLHQLNLGAIRTPQSPPGVGKEVETFAEKYRLVLLNSTRRLVFPNTSKVVTNDGYIVGGVRYDADNTAIYEHINYAIASSRSMALADELPFQMDSTNRGGSWNYLPGTATEASDLSHILQTVNFDVQLDTGYLATEETFRSLGIDKSSPRILHIATHGFFFPDPEEIVGRPQLAVHSAQVFKMSEHPMIRSGLILAGAQEAWTTGKAPENREDGILTAYEICLMNLSNTELVVLSACETGLGDIEGNEGVYGLQRAFKIAGAKYLIMSLWKVNDQSTRELMTDFYSHWLIKKMDIPDAFRTAQSNMRLKYPDAPYHWAGFVLVE